jgi:hypothetical protein
VGPDIGVETLVVPLEIVIVGISNSSQNVNSDRYDCPVGGPANLRKSLSPSASAASARGVKDSMDAPRMSDQIFASSWFEGSARFWS